ncbi:MAG: HAMP domain-containing histidine kinase [Peptococcaceae bacterium]|jgi:signal transduction histidine kinase|nr:HAMP domain-containing histidine kinase [Peptococcaceae bacterium]
MRLSWKIFFTTLVITILTFSVGGYILISSSFQAALNREIVASLEENKMLRYAFRSAVATASAAGERGLEAIAETVISYSAGDKLKIRIWDEDNRVIRQSGGVDFGAGLLGKIIDGSRMHTIVEQEGAYFVQTISAVNAQRSKVYIESFHDITPVFIDRQGQFGIYRRLILTIAVLNGVLIFAVSFWTAYPIRRLSRATRRIAQGRYSNRVEVHTSDELGMLADDFNEMAESLEVKMRDLEEAAIRQRDFVGSFAHEAKTPLTSIIGYGDMLRSQQLGEEERMLAADYVYSEGKRLEALSLKLLELIVLQNQEFPMKNMSMKQLFESIEGILYPMLKDTEIGFTWEAPDEVISVEPDLIKTLILNLVDNARKAVGNAGRICLTGARVSEDSYHITVEDDGKGIPEEEISRITEAFYMVDKSRSRASGGAGLGLAICSEIVRLHDGEMQFESVLGEGTKVTIVLKG